MRFSAMPCATRAICAGSRASLQRAIALMPPSAGVFIDLGITYLRPAKLDKALGQLEAGLNLPLALAADARLARRHRRPRQALATEPDRAEAHNVLGLLLGRDRAPIAAEVAAQFREAIRLRPDFAEAHNTSVSC